MNQPTALENGQERPWRLGCAFLTLVVALLAAVPIVYLGYHYALRQLPSLFSRPLYPDAQARLCEWMDLADDARCTADSAYAHEFLPELRKRYPTGTNAEAVSSELRAYADHCTGWISRGDNGDFQDCQYSLDGDRHLMLYVTGRKDSGAADESGEVWRICSFDVGNGSLWDIYVCDPPMNTGLLLVMSDNTFLAAPGFGIAFLAFDLLILGLVVLLRRPLGVWR